VPVPLARRTFRQSLLALQPTAVHCTYSDPYASTTAVSTSYSCTVQLYSCTYCTSSLQLYRTMVATDRSCGSQRQAGAVCVYIIPEILIFRKRQVSSSALRRKSE
jgi:hypothetical protein